MRLSSRSEEDRKRAEASFKKKELQAREGAKAFAEYEAANRATTEKTARLKALRLAKEAADAETKARSVPAISTKRRKVVVE
jgi:hypothetical protein